MLAFRYLVPYMDDDELRRVYEVMREKELRICVEWDDEMFERCRRTRRSSVMEQHAGRPTTGGAGLPLQLPSDDDEDADIMRD